MWERGNSLPNDKIIDCSKFKAFADDKIIVTQELKYGFGKLENIVGNGENRKCWLSAFSPFPTMFSKTFFSRGVRSQYCLVQG